MTTNDAAERRLRRMFAAWIEYDEERYSDLLPLLDAALAAEFSRGYAEALESCEAVVAIQEVRTRRATVERIRAAANEKRFICDELLDYYDPEGDNVRWDDLLAILDAELSAPQEPTVEAER